jgi:hypothetical protein
LSADLLLTLTSFDRGVFLASGLAWSRETEAAFLKMSDPDKADLGSFSENFEAAS